MSSLECHVCFPSVACTELNHANSLISFFCVFCDLFASLRTVCRSCKYACFSDSIRSAAAISESFSTGLQAKMSPTRDLPRINVSLDMPVGKILNPYIKGRKPPENIAFSPRRYTVHAYRDQSERNRGQGKLHDPMEHSPELALLSLLS